MWHGTYGLHAYNAPIVPFLRVDSSPLESFHQSVHTFFANPSHWDWRTRAVRWNQGIENNLWRAGKKIRSWSCSKVISHHASPGMFPISSSLDYLCESKYPLKSIEGVFISVWVPYSCSTWIAGIFQRGRFRVWIKWKESLGPKLQVASLILMAEKGEF